MSSASFFLAPKARVNYRAQDFEENPGGALKASALNLHGAKSF
jgi:hypothetical protein